MIVLAGASGRKREGKHVMFEVNRRNQGNNGLLWIQQDASGLAGDLSRLGWRRCSSCISACSECFNEP